MEGFSELEICVSRRMAKYLAFGRCSPRSTTGFWSCSGLPQRLNSYHGSTRPSRSRREDNHYVWSLNHPPAAHTPDPSPFESLLGLMVDRVHTFGLRRVPARKQCAHELMGPLTECRVSRYVGIFRRWQLQALGVSRPCRLIVRCWQMPRL